MKDLNQKIKRLLTTKKHLRDNDAQLIADVWKSELSNISNPTGHDVLSLLSTRKISWPDSITRERRLIQAEFKELRGKKWEARHAKAEEVRKTIKRK